MNILVLNGSPKGEYSVTLQTVRYIEQHNPTHQFRILHVGQRIRALENDPEAVREALEWADLWLFSYPVYTFMAPSQLHRFIRFIKPFAPKGKFATQLTTSKHFYDITAHRYIEDNCLDMECRYIRGLSADMDDLLCQQGRKEALEFFAHTLFCTENGLYEMRSLASSLFKPITATAVPHTEKRNGDVVIITDCTDSDTSLRAMIERFRAVLPLPTRVINLNDLTISGGCLGCFNCAVSGKCIYKDGFDSFLREKIQTAQATVYAFRILDHSMGPLFKLYDDRQFCNGHRTVTMGMSVGYLISGSYSDQFNLQTVVEARAQVGHHYLAGVATDERDPDGEIDRLAKNLTYAVENGYVPPQNFYGIGGMKIFRDLIWLMQGMMKADHKFYKAHGQYDFPQKHRMTMLKMYAVGALLSSPQLKARMGNRMNEGMLMPYKKVLNKRK